VAITSPIVLEVKIAARPSVVRSQPADADKKIDRDQTISVRFSTPMDKRITRSALRVSGLDPLKEANVSWLENGRVLVLNPTKDFGYGEKVTIAVLATARSAAGVTLGDGQGDRLRPPSRSGEAGPEAEAGSVPRAPR
jgi:hypothetical protein